jgi:glucose-6-phosphate isomerase
LQNCKKYSIIIIKLNICIETAYCQEEKMSVKLNTNYLTSFIDKDELTGIKAQAEAAAQLLHSKTGLGNDFLGWVELPTNYDKEEFERIKAAAKKIQSDSDILIVIGIGGSYLGARAAIEFLKSPLYNNMKKDTPDIYYVGNSINPTYLQEIISICEGKDVSVNIISKSGTTTEPALAFRVFKKLLEDKYGKEEAKNRIYATTDKAKGTLKNLSDEMGYETFVIPDDVGGRFSVLTPVGLLPIAVAGCDIDALMEGARKAQQDYTADFDNNDCYKYAALRNIFYRKGKAIELLVSYDPSFTMMSEWYKQLFGESEGKDNKGLFPASVVFSTDLHSMGQFIQQGSRVMFETVVDIKKPKIDLYLEEDAENLDGLNFLTNQNMSVVNRKAFEGTVLAHTEGNVPNIILELEDTTEKSLGYLIYFFEKACAISGYMLGVNPFNQPGVESYKSNMFALLGKPGYEGAKAELEAKLGR